MENSGRKFTSIMFLAIAGLLASLTVHADGDTRPATQAEKDFNKSVFDVLIKAVPPGPDGWEQGHDNSEDKNLERVTPDSEKYPFENFLWH